MPCYNEEGNVGIIVERILHVLQSEDFSTLSSAGDAEILLINDGSDDRTAESIEILQEKNDCVFALHHKKNSGLMAAWETGVREARGEYICFIDADLQNPPEEIPGLYKEILHNHCDMVQGVRVASENLSKGRFILTKGLNFLLNTAFSMRAADNKSGFVIAKAQVVRDIFTRKFHYYHFHCFIRVAAEAKGYRVLEHKTLFVDRHSGESFISTLPVRLIFEILVDTFKALIEFRLSRR